MEDKEAIEILMRMLERGSLSSEEKAAIETAVGALGWTKLGAQRIKNIIHTRKAEREYKPRDNELLK